MSGSNLLEQLTRPKQPLSVTELSLKLKTLVEGRFLNVWVEGEISNFRKQSSGHWYFSLKDESAMIRCAFFRTYNRLARFEPSDGMMVRAKGKVSIYEERSEYQLLLEFLEPSGYGERQIAFEQLKAKLAKEGLFAQDRKRPLPLLPRRIGVVTSPSGAAIRDILRTIKRRNEAVSVLVAPVRVQGDGAAREIVAAIEALNSFGGFDAIIVGRGGGSAEDLSCFNDEQVARAIYNSAIPVISAVGHETDFTLADFVSDMRASTPSAAAEMVAAARDEIASRVQQCERRLAGAMRYQILTARHSLGQLRSRPALHVMPPAIDRMWQRVDEAVYAASESIRKSLKELRAGLGTIDQRLQELDSRKTLSQYKHRLSVLTSRLDRRGIGITGACRRRTSTATAKLEALSPLSVLSRGYAIAFDSTGHAIKSASSVEQGQRVHVRVSSGEFDCTVD